MAQYDEKIIHEFADQLYRRANTIIALFSLVGAIIGLFAGWGVGQYGTKRFIYALIAGGIGGGIGYYIGTARAFVLKLQAQTALCQAQIEKNTK